MSNFVALIILAAFAVLVWGAIKALFIRGKRKSGLIHALLAMVVIMAMGIIEGGRLDKESQALGFTDHRSHRAALDAGITDPDVWAVEVEKIEAERQAKAIAEQNRIEAEKAAEQAADEERRRNEEELRRREEAEAEAARLAEEEKRNREREDERRKGFHCLSAWDGSHAEFKRAVRSAMREPDSFEHIETRITPVGDDGFHTLMMQYRARNGFGGMNVSTAYARIENSTCSYEVVYVE